MSDPKLGSYTSEDFNNLFGLSSREGIGAGYNKAAGATDDDATKDNAIMGKGYLSNDDYKRLLKDENFQRVYAEHNDISGQDNAFDENSLTINRMDGFFDDLTGSDPDKKPDAGPEMKPIEYSPELQQAHDRVNQWESEVWSGEQSEAIFGQQQDVKSGAPGDLGKQQKDAANNLANNYISGIKRDIEKQLSEGISV